MDSHPNPALRHMLINVTKDIPGVLDLAPLQMGEAFLLGASQASRRFGDDLKTSRDGIERPPIFRELIGSHPGHKVLRGPGILPDGKPSERLSWRWPIVRRHRSRRAQR